MGQGRCHHIAERQRIPDLQPDHCYQAFNEGRDGRLFDGTRPNLPAVSGELPRRSRPHQRNDR